VRWILDLRHWASLPFYGSGSVMGLEGLETFVRLSSCSLCCFSCAYCEVSSEERDAGGIDLLCLASKEGVSSLVVFWLCTSEIAFTSLLSDKKQASSFLFQRFISPGNKIATYSRAAATCHFSSSFASTLLFGPTPHCLHLFLCKDTI